MGASDFINSATDTLKRNTPNLTSIKDAGRGLRDFAGSTADAAKQNAPDLKSVTTACWSSYDYACSAVGKVDGAVRGNVFQRLNHYMPDEEGRAVIGRVAVNFIRSAGHHSYQECLKLLPGGAFVNNVITRSLQDIKPEDSEELKKVVSAWKHNLGKESSCTLSGEAFVNNVITQSRQGIKPEDSEELKKVVLAWKDNLGKESNIILSGGIQFKKVRIEGLQDQLFLHASGENKKPNFVCVMEASQAKKEVQEEMNKLKQQNKISTHGTKGSESSKEVPDEPTAGSTSPSN